MRIFVGNLPFDATNDDLRKIFEPFGEVGEVSIARERSTSESRGFAFIDMPTKQEAITAIAELNGKEFMGRDLNVNEARPRPEMDRGRAGGGGGFGGHNKPDSRRRDSKRRRPGDSRGGGKSRFGKRPY